MWIAVLRSLLTFPSITVPGQAFGSLSSSTSHFSHRNCILGYPLFLGNREALWRSLLSGLQLHGTRPGGISALLNLDPNFSSGTRVGMDLAGQPSDLLTELETLQIPLPAQFLPTSTMPPVPSLGHCVRRKQRPEIRESFLFLTVQSLEDNCTENVQIQKCFLQIFHQKYSEKKMVRMGNDVSFPGQLWLQHARHVESDH